MTEPPAHTTKRTAWPWIVMSTGVALIVTAAVFQVKAVAEEKDRDEADTRLSALPPGDPGSGPLVATIADHEKSADNSRTASLIIGTAGFLTVAGAVVWWFVEGGGSPDPKAKTAIANRDASSAKPSRFKASLLPSFSPSYAGAALGGTF